MNAYDDFSVDVRVQVPRRRFKTLRREAERQGTDVSRLLRALVIESVAEAPEPLYLTGPERDAYICRRNEEGAIDAVIAEELGLSKTQTAHRRALLGLPANGRKKTREQVVS